MNTQNESYGGIPGSAPYYNMNLPSQNNGVVATQQIQNPVSPLQQFSNYNQPQIKRVPARIINDPKEIMPNEVPMDGSVSLFPTADYSCVYAKAWNANGMIDTVKYVPEKPETQPETRIIFLSNDLSGSFLEKVLIHEIGHCALFSFHLVDDIHRMVRPEYWIEAEEWICNFIADYGQIIYSTVYSYLGVHAWKAIPYELERLIA